MADGMNPSERRVQSVGGTGAREPAPPPPQEANHELTLGGHPADHLRAVYLLTSEFNEDEPNTVVTSPPGAEAHNQNPDFLSEPVDRPILLRLDGVEAGEVVSLRSFPCDIGRHPNCGLILDDAGVSRRHAQLVADEDDLFLVDLGSRNGTFIEGVRIDRAPLKDGCLIQIGLHVGFRYTLVDARQETLLRDLYRSSTRDALTGLYNRRHFDDRLRSEIAYALRHKADLGVLLVDIDFFKRINDTYGHAGGDAALRQISKTLAQQLRTEDIIARVGGEEFAVLLRGTDAGGAARLGERLRAAVETNPIMYENHSIPLTISVGCASFTELEEVDAARLFKLADDRLYQAKRSGRNRVVQR